MLTPQVLRQVYQTEIKRDLLEDIKSETSGNYEKVLARSDMPLARSYMMV
jgi:hypothetical protein